ncbi:hypothetical protein PVK06_030256 [Gossypium arboreum]|uniref:MULE transposase domain-containing protein n=1 Tax=Gossypium arboreum TaxID=29729 RepID=A0ABR0NMS8_GOSAR|nr:hypothetical protein PVK06_030256 [Gossypium arboreum]
MVQTHLASRAPYIELYVQFASPNDTFAAAVRKEYMTPARHSISGLHNTEPPVFGSGMEYTTPARHSVSGWDMHLGGSMFDAGNTYWGTTSTYSARQSTSNWGRYETPRRRDDVLPMTSIGEGTSYVADDGGLDDEFDVDPPLEPGRDGTEVGLFSESEPIPIEPEDVEGGSDEEEDPRFRAYSPPAHMHNVDLSADDSGRILPIAFAITPGESADDWDFFLSRLRMHVCPQPDVYVISDRGTGILAAIERQGSLWHHTHHRYCLRHNASNYYRQYPSKGERRQMANMVVRDIFSFSCTISETSSQLCRPNAGRPCMVRKACQNLRLDPMSYVDDVYKLEYMYNMWRHIFPIVPDECKWPSVSLAPFKLLLDRELRRKPKGRPCSTRIRNNMDIRETTNQQKLCGWCRNPGHTSRSCPNRNS